MDLQGGFVSTEGKVRISRWATYFQTSKPRTRVGQGVLMSKSSCSNIKACYGSGVLTFPSTNRTNTLISSASLVCEKGPSWWRWRDWTAIIWCFSLWPKKWEKWCQKVIRSNGTKRRCITFAFNFDWLRIARKYMRSRRVLRMVCCKDIQQRTDQSSALDSLERVR